MRRRRRKKDLKHDQFVDTVENVLRWTLSHRDRAITIILGIVAVVVVGYMIFTPKENYSSEAELLLFQAKELVSLGKYQESEELLTYLIQNFGSTSSGIRGHYYLGVIHTTTGRFDDAVIDFDRFLNAGKKSYLLYPSALVGRGGAREATGDLEGAYQDFKKAGEMDSPIKNIARLQWGRVAGFMGDTEEAKEILEGLIEEEAGTSIADDAKLYLGLINSRTNQLTPTK